MKEEQKGRRRAGAIIAIASGVALLAGGSTFALWSASAAFNANSDVITAGNLNLVAGGSSTSWDVSVGRTDETANVTDPATQALDLTFASATDASSAQANVNATNQLMGHSVTLGTWLAVPGDTVAVTMPYTITLTGDNLVADLTVDPSTLVKEANITNMSFALAVFGADGKQVGTTATVSSTSSTTPVNVATFQANGAGQSAGVDDKDASGNTITTVGTDGTAAVTLVVFGYFNQTTPDRVDATLADTLGQINATLTQVRNA